MNRLASRLFCVVCVVVSLLAFTDRVVAVVRRVAGVRRVVHGRAP